MLGMESPNRPTEAKACAVPSNPMQALIELRDRMQVLHAELEYARLLLRLEARAQP